ncbi:MAG: response regulator [Candidatus Ornithospirochaeta sp.]
MIRVMLAEDSEVIRTYIKETLEKDGDILVKSECSTGEEAEEKYETGEYDVVLMDIEMADRDDGIRAADAILVADGSAKILYLTSHESDDTIVKAMSNGALDYVVKGCDDETLRKKVRMANEGNSQIDSEIQKVLMDEYKRLRKSEKNLLYFIQNLGNLTPAEKELISCFMEGLKVREIAERRFVEPATVKSQIRTLLQKFGVSRSTEVVKMVKELGIEHLFPPMKR